MKPFALLGFGSLLMLGACVSPGPSSGLSTLSAFVPTSVAVDAPEGFMQMCAASPDLCAAPKAGAPVVADLAGARTEPSRLLLVASARDSNPSLLDGDRVADAPPSDRFVRSADARGAGVDAEVVGESKAAGANLDQMHRLALLNQVNRRVNGAVRQITDAQLFGTTNYWRRSGIGPGATGDCKDLAVEKRMDLIELGFPAEDLFLAIVFRADLGYHALLIARTDDGDMVLDSRSAYIVPWKDAPYIWVKRQSRQDPTAWSLVAGPPAGYADLRTVKSQKIASNDDRAIQPRFQ